MTTLTVTIDPALLEAAKREAERRQITLDQLISDTLANTAQPPPINEDSEELIRLMYEHRLGTIDRPLTRGEIYEKRTWPRSQTETSGC